MILLNFMKTVGAQMSATFPHCDQRGNRGGSSVSAFSPGPKASAFPAASCVSRRVSRTVQWGLCLLCLLCLSLCASAHADQTPRQQMDSAIHRHLNNLMNQHAREQGWKGLRLELDNTPLSSLHQLAPCPGQIEVSGGSLTKLSRQSLRLTCDQASQGWPINVSTDMKVFLPVVISTRVINRGDNITAALLKSEETDITRASRGFYHRTAPLIGMSAKRRIRANQILTPDLIDQPQLIKRGDKVNIIASQDGISASMQGEALEKGSAAEVIRVKNLSSGKTIEAKVLEAGVVTSIF